ncbi:type IV pilus biogenesis/stability protein PilW [Pseudidiomarina sp.]|uniref:type IV pilus biogenesis/stability protein PilW n=1 Tax=Pseudidiomarina sp. TaxID=2081707 RepID=UPI00299CFD75|nr:type IV pilus biogenesis/stability protein PilW [Pseudidiomarina sp.]MDX1705329.1 type IV pilus biogenesis/stability protein PilW [Pseudidiomarina sp.]
MRALLLTLVVASLLLSGCVSQRTVDGESQPTQQLDEQEAARVRLALGLQYLRSQNYQLAKANLERARDYTPDNPAVHTGLAYYYQQVKDFKRAEQYYRSAIKLNPDDGDTLNNLAVLLCSQGQYKEALAYFNEAVSQPEYVKVASTWQNAATCATKQGDYAAADRYYRLAINHDPQNSTILESYAGLLLRQQRYADAQRVLAQRADLPQFTPQYLWLEVQLARALGNEAKALAFSDLLLSRFPQSEQAKRLLKNS